MSSSHCPIYNNLQPGVDPSPGWWRGQLQDHCGISALLGCWRPRRWLLTRCYNFPPTNWRELKYNNRRIVEMKWPSVQSCSSQIITQSHPHRPLLLGTNQQNWAEQNAFLKAIAHVSGRTFKLISLFTFSFYCVFTFYLNKQTMVSSNWILLFSNLKQFVLK